MSELQSFPQLHTGDARGLGSLAELRSLSGSARAWLAAQFSLRNATLLGARPRVYGRPTIDNSGELIIGGRVQLFSKVATTEFVVGANGLLTIGEQCLIMDGTTISAQRHVEIGDRCLFGRQTQILDCAFHYVDPDRRLESPDPDPVVVGNNVWLASRVTVLPGVEIGDGAAVAAGAVVASNVAPKTLVGGVPARKIRDL